MLDTSYAEARQAVYRMRRVPDDIRRINEDASISAVAASLLIWMIDRPPHWRFLVAHIITIRNADGKPRWGGRNKVRALLAELMVAGYVTVDREGREGGGFQAGIYLVSDQKRWVGAVDILGGEIAGDDAEIGDSQTETRAPSFGALRIDNSICDPDTPNRALVENSVRSCPTSKAERAPAPAKSHVTGGAEPSQGSASAGSPGATRKNERRQGAANGSAVKGSARGGQLSAKNAKSADVSTDKNRNIERHRQQLIDAGGRALANPRTTPGLWRLFEVIAWVASGCDFEADILPTIREVSARATLEPGSVVSWRYYTAAVRAAHARRNNLDLPKPAGKRAPRLDPYAPAPRDPDDGSAWSQIGLAAMLGRARGGG